MRNNFKIQKQSYLKINYITAFLTNYDSVLKPLTPIVFKDMQLIYNAFHNIYYRNIVRNLYQKKPSIKFLLNEVM